MFDTEKYTWIYNSNICTVKNKATGVYIRFPLIQCGTKDESTERWYAYWSWNYYTWAVVGNYYHGLEFFHSDYGAYKDPPIDGHLFETDKFPIRLVKKK